MTERVSIPEERGMKHKLNQVMGFALAGLLAMAPVGLAGGAAGERSKGPSATTQMQHPGTSAKTEKGDRIQATVERVDPSKHAVELKATDGETIELPAPSQMLSELKPGDTVELSIHKISGTRQRGATGMPKRGSSGATARPVNPSGPPSESSGPTD
jgi:hypothetical protein